MITYDHIESFDADPREGIRSRLAGKSFVYAGFKLIGALVSRGPRSGRREVPASVAPYISCTPGIGRMNSCAVEKL